MLPCPIFYSFEDTSAAQCEENLKSLTASKAKGLRVNSKGSAKRPND